MVHFQSLAYGAIVAILLAVPISEAKQQFIPNKYIVKFRKSADIQQVDSLIHEKIESFNNEIKSSFGVAGAAGGNQTSPLCKIARKYTMGQFKAFAGTLSKDIVKSLRGDPNVEYIEQEQVFTMAGVQNNPPNWGLARISQRQRNPNAPYNFPNSAGQGIDVYVIDTGINVRHRDFGGRASLPVSFIEGEPTEDLNGHGSHVAGIVGGNTYGVAKKVRLIGVKVLGRDGRGSTSGIIAGVNWVTRQARSTGRRSVINMSLGGGNSNALNAAVDAAVQAGIPVIVAAGNESQDACNVSPANGRSAFTVGATDYYDNAASYSNWGRCVKIQAPGSNILSTYIGSPDARNSLSGTSMASPQVAGIAALYMSEGSANSPQSVYNSLTGRATRNVVRGLRGNSPNLMAYSLTN
ncbi:hypothetical protein K7432_000340 [Basidiobolus ranarum]|uniref:Uncharacterized protein n=1 Tax=Basidiobolus ranarum TaxID=34480 RepID=A0ABR2WBC9_9FUNG